MKHLILGFLAISLSRSADTEIQLSCPKVQLEFLHAYFYAFLEMSRGSPEEDKCTRLDLIITDKNRTKSVYEAFSYSGGFGIRTDVIVNSEGGRLESFKSTKSSKNLIGLDNVVWALQNDTSKVGQFAMQISTVDKNGKLKVLSTSCSRYSSAADGQRHQNNCK